MTKNGRVRMESKDNPRRFDNLPKDELRAIQIKATKAHKTAAFSKTMSEVTTRRHFRNKNPDIAALMSAYDSNDQLGVMEKYVTDNEKFVSLFKEANTVESKASIWAKYQSFQLKIFELMFGNKSFNINADVKVDWSKDVDRILAGCIEVCPHCGKALTESQ